jgi:hypothetical protein
MLTFEAAVLVNVTFHTTVDDGGAGLGDCDPKTAVYVGV